VPRACSRYELLSLLSRGLRSMRVRKDRPPACQMSQRRERERRKRTPGLFRRDRIGEAQQWSGDLDALGDGVVYGLASLGELPGVGFALGVSFALVLDQLALAETTE
jgi:hypothetical protein